MAASHVFVVQLPLKKPRTFKKLFQQKSPILQFGVIYLNEFCTQWMNIHILQLHFITYKMKDIN